MKKKPDSRLADPDTLRAARRAIAEAREARKSAEIRTIVTGVPRPGRDGTAFPKWKPVSPPYFPKGVGPSKPQPKPVEAEPPPRPTVWKYVWVQTRAPRSDNDCGAIIEAQYAITADGVLYLETTSGNPIASQKLRSDDNPLHVAVRLLRDKGRNNSSVRGFYGDIPNNGRQTYH